MRDHILKTLEAKGITIPKTLNNKNLQKYLRKMIARMHLVTSEHLSGTTQSRVLVTLLSNHPTSRGATSVLTYADVC
jgi:hypothetical protein